ncbi:hypothetical protein BH10PSE5_BH10PSE5_15190 [soil metagenome]
MQLKVNPLDTQMAVISWDDRARKGGASYSLDLGPAAARAGPGADLVFSAADAGISSLPAGFKPPKTKGKAEKAALDWSVVLIDTAGAEARLPLSNDQVLYPQIQGRTRRFPEIDGSKVAEVVMRRYRLPLADFAKANPAVDLAHLKAVRFDFDRSRRGAVALDDVGIAPAVVSQAGVAVPLRP